MGNKQVNKKTRVFRIIKVLPVRVLLVIAFLGTPLFYLVDKFEIIYCFKGEEECRLKENLYEYQNDHQYIPYGKEVTKLDNNSSLRPCDSYKIRFNFKKTNLWWGDSWSTTTNDRVYIFQVDVDDKITGSIHDIKLLLYEEVSLTKGHLSLPKEVDEYSSLQDSEIGRKEIYLLDFEEGTDGELKKEYQMLSDGGEKDTFYEEVLKKNNAPSFSFELKEDGTCPSVKVEDNKCWPVNFEVYYEYMDSDFDKYELTSKSKLGDNDSYKIKITMTEEQDAYISIFLKDHVTNECHPLYLMSSSDKIRDEINYIPQGTRFHFAKSEQRGAKTIFVRATSCLEDYPKLQDCPPQNKCTDDCVSSQTFYFE